MPRIPLSALRWLTCFLLWPLWAWSQTSAPINEAPATTTGPIRLEAPREPAPGSAAAQTGDTLSARDPRALYNPGEFERFVRRAAAPVEVRRFGSDLSSSAFASTAVDALALVPPDYIVAPGDEVLVTLWGSVEADLRLTVDRSGRISIPRVGAIAVSGVRAGELAETVSRRVEQVFKNFRISVSLGALRGVRVFVTGFVERPGAYVVGGLASLTTALLRAGGPSAAGSFRAVELRRGGRSIASFDLYDFLLRGDRSADQLLQAGDVIHVSAVGPQAAVIGSVNQPAVFELKPGETLEDLLRMAGGFSAVADRTRATIERLSDRNNLRVTQLKLPQEGRTTLSEGDLVRVFSAVDAALPVRQQNKRVRIEGEVARPGEYVLPADSSVTDALRAAGGLTQAAYLYGTEFNRESVRASQQENYDRALRDLETEFARARTVSGSAIGSDEASQAHRSTASAQLIERLRALKPSGRIVLQLTPEGSTLPDLALEDGDRLYIPPRPTTVGVFGSVFNAGNYLHGEGRTLGDYLRLAGGPTRGADDASTFVIRANGSVISARQGRRLFGGGNENLVQLRAEPGDTVFVPEEIDKTTLVQAAKDWTQVLYQFGIGIAGIRGLR